jgi:hypothetical protein
LPLTAEPELTNTILPPLSLLRKAGKAACTAVINEKKLTSKWLFHRSTEVSAEPMRQRGSRIPAFKIRPSTRPYVSSTCAIAADKDGPSVLGHVNNLKMSGQGNTHTSHNLTRSELYLAFSSESSTVSVRDIEATATPNSCKRILVMASPIPLPGDIHQQATPVTHRIYELGGSSDDHDGSIGHENFFEQCQRADVDDCFFDFNAHLQKATLSIVSPPLLSLVIVATGKYGCSCTLSSHACHSQLSHSTIKMCSSNLKIRARLCLRERTHGQFISTFLSKIWSLTHELFTDDCSRCAQYCHGRGNDAR